MAEISRAFVVSHTHWDREWYRTLEEFQQRFVDVMERALTALEEDSAFRHFLLDGQTILLEDYLARAPGQESRVRSLIESGRLAVGPWYVLADEFLVSGESLVRNLLIGAEVARRHGGRQAVGYMPDSFGHVAQLPQLLRLAGLDSFVYTRGNGAAIDETGCEYWWQGPDGSRVLALHQPGGYINGGHLGFEDADVVDTGRAIDVALAVRQLDDLLRRIATVAASGIALINNGYDHLPPQERLGEILDGIREQRPDVDIRQGSLAEYVEAVREQVPESNTYSGELRHGRDHFVLSGVWSTRTYLKQANDRCEALLTGSVEPLLAYGHFVLGRTYPEAALDRLWRRLLENHPHDSICGCSVDAVHRAMMPRFEQVEAGAHELLRSLFAEVAPTMGPTPEDDGDVVLAVFNPGPEARAQVVERVVVLPEEGREWGLFDEDGRPVPFHVRERRTLRAVWGPDIARTAEFSRQAEAIGPFVDHFRGTTEARRREFLTIEFVASTPALAHRNYFLRAIDEPPTSPAGSVVTTERTLQNETLQILLHDDGTFDVTDQVNGDTYEGLNVLVDEAEIGDSYDHCPIDGDAPLTPEPAQSVVCCESSSPLVGVLSCRFAWALPVVAATDRERRTAETRGCEVEVRLTLRHGARHVEVETTFENRVRDHRLRVRFPTDLETDRVGSDGHFLLIERPIEEHSTDDWAQEALPTRPQQEFSWLRDDERGLAILSRGLPEVEAERTADGTALSVTLLRCVEWLSRHDVASRRHANAGPTFQVPEAQCPGVHTFRYAVLPFRSDPVAAEVPTTSRDYRSPFLVTQGVAQGHVPGTSGLIECSSRSVRITAIKRHQSRDRLVVRLHNLTSLDTDVTLECAHGVEQAWHTDPLEERTAEAAVRDDTVPVTLRGHEIATLEITLSPPDPPPRERGAPRPAPCEQ